MLFWLLRLSCIGLCFGSLVVFHLAETQLKEFLKKHTNIADNLSLNAYKVVVRNNMYLTLTQIGIVGSLLSLSAVGFLNKDMSGIFIAPLFCLVIGFGNREIPKLEEKIRSLPVDSYELERQYQNINKTWRKKALPDF
jgi:hypothetical protein